MLTLSTYGGGGNMVATSRSAYYVEGQTANGTKYSGTASAASVEAGFLLGLWSQGTGNLLTKEVAKYAAPSKTTRFATSPASFMPVPALWGKSRFVGPQNLLGTWQVFGLPANAT